MNPARLKAALERAVAIRRIYAAARAASGRDKLTESELAQVQGHIVMLDFATHDLGVSWAKLRRLRWVDALAAR